MSLLDLQAALVRVGLDKTEPTNYHRALLRCGLVELVGLSAEDATAYVDGTRLAELPQAQMIVGQRVRDIMADRMRA